LETDRYSKGQTEDRAEKGKLLSAAHRVENKGKPLRVREALGNKARSGRSKEKKKGKKADCPR